MVESHNLWIFGDSNCLPYSLSKKDTGWDTIIATELQASLRNFAQVATDNFFIFNCLMDNLKDIGDQDTVIIGWTHPYRKTFIYDPIRHEHLLEISMAYDTNTNKFIRSKRNDADVKDNLAKWTHMHPDDSGVDYYDKWFKNYFSETEQKVNSQCYMLAAQELLADKRYLPFYFSMESVDGFTVDNKKMCVVDFIKENNLQISDDDAHMSYKGHDLWSKELLKKLKI